MQRLLQIYLSALKNKYIQHLIFYAKLLLISINFSHLAIDLSKIKINYARLSASLSSNF